MITASERALDGFVKEIPFRLLTLLVAPNGRRTRTINDYNS
jgi:hypothetical protein